MATIKPIVFRLFSSVKSQSLITSQFRSPQTIPTRNKYTLRRLRTKLPKYKKDLYNLPDLTKLLVESVENRQLGQTLKLWESKVAVYKEYLPDNHPVTLLEALFNQDNDVDKLLRVIDENLESMTSFYIGVSFEVIDDMLRAELCVRDTVIVSPEFRKLSTKALYKMRFFDSDDVLRVVKCLSSLHLSEDTLLVQATLSMARHLINDFTPEELRVITGSFDLLKPVKFIETTNTTTREVKTDDTT